MAGRAAVDRFGQHRHARRNAGNFEFGAGLLHQSFVHTRRDRGQELAVGRGANAFARAGDADELFSLVVPGRHFVVGDGPVAAQAVEGIGFEIVIGKAQGDAAVVVGASAQDARTEPVATFASLGDGVGFAGNIPVAVGRGEIAPLLASEIELGSRARAAMVDFIGPDVLFEILLRIEHGSGFEQRDVDSLIGEHFHGSAAAGAGTNHHDVMHLRRTLNLGHRPLS